MFLRIHASVMYYEKKKTPIWELKVFTCPFSLQWYTSHLGDSRYKYVGTLMSI